MTGFVLDCSIAIAWLFEDEADPVTDALLERLVEKGAIVPDLWHLEVCNVLIQAEKRGRVTEEHVASSLKLLSNLSIKTDTEGVVGAFENIVPLARRHSLTAYDATYLELALRLELPLATNDKALRKAAQTVGLATLPG